MHSHVRLKRTVTDPMSWHWASTAHPVECDLSVSWNMTPVPAEDLASTPLEGFIELVR